MKLILACTLAAALPLAAQSTDTNTPSSAQSPMNNPAADEPVVVAPPVDTNAAVTSAPAMPAPDTTAGMSAASAPPALSPDPFSDPLIAKIVVRYQKAWDGDKKEARSLTTDLEGWMKMEPGNYLLMAYLGSAYALDSRDAWIGPGKLSYLKKASATLDAAVAGDPSNPAIRLLRAMNYYSLPSVFGKHKAAHDDFAYLIQQLNGVLPMPYDLTNDTRQAVYYYAGLSDVQFDQPAEARDAWQRGLTIAPQSPLGQKTQAELNKLK